MGGGPLLALSKSMASTHTWVLNLLDGTHLHAAKETPVDGHLQLQHANSRDAETLYISTYTNTHQSRISSTIQHPGHDQHLSQQSEGWLQLGHSGSLAASWASGDSLLSTSTHQQRPQGAALQNISFRSTVGRSFGPHSAHRIPQPARRLIYPRAVRSPRGHPWWQAPPTQAATFKVSLEPFRVQAPEGKIFNLKYADKAFRDTLRQQLRQVQWKQAQKRPHFRSDSRIDWEATRRLYLKRDYTLVSELVSVWAMDCGQPLGSYTLVTLTEGSGGGVKFRNSPLAIYFGSVLISGMPNQRLCCTIVRWLPPSPPPLTVGSVSPIFRTFCVPNGTKFSNICAGLRKLVGLSLLRTRLTDVPFPTHPPNPVVAVMMVAAVSLLSLLLGFMPDLGS